MKNRGFAYFFLFTIFISSTVIYSAIVKVQSISEGERFTATQSGRWLSREKGLILIPDEVKEKLSGRIYSEASSSWQLTRTIPDDLNALQWSLDHSNNYDINAPEAWDITTGSKDVIVAVIDTGMDIDHEDMIGNIWVNKDEIAGNGIDDDLNGYIDDIHGWNTRDANGAVDDLFGHGTFVGGIIGARGNNSLGICGVNYNTSLMILNAFGNSNETDTEFLIEAIDYAVRNGAQIINASWGSNGYSPAMEEMIDYARQNGVLFVAASGNDADNIDDLPFFPAAYANSNVISVGSHELYGEVSSFSNYGRLHTDLVAPGTSCYSLRPGSSYGQGSGTSYAAPHVAGTAALLLSAYPSLHYWDVKAKIMGSVRVNSDLDLYVASTGYLDAASALQTVPSGELPELSIQLGYIGSNGCLLKINDDQSHLYDIRYHTMPFTDDSFYEVQPAQMKRSRNGRLILDGLAQDTTYSIAVRKINETGYCSKMSNVIDVHTRSRQAVFENLGEEGETGFLAESQWKRTSSRYYEGASCWTIQNDQMTYGPNQNSVLTSELIDTSGLHSPCLTFVHQHQFYPSVMNQFDYGVVECSTDDGKSWEILRYYYSLRSYWKDESITLPENPGAIRVRFRFVSDDIEDVEDEIGWFIDQIRIEEGYERVRMERNLFFEPYHLFDIRRPENEYKEAAGAGSWTTQYKSVRLPGKETRLVQYYNCSQGLNASALSVPTFPVKGRYRVYGVYGSNANAKNVRYTIRDIDGMHEVLLDQDGFKKGNSWIDLGVYSFHGGRSSEKGSVSIDNRKCTGAVYSDNEYRMDVELFRCEFESELIQTDAGHVYKLF